ncbi:uncharacterized protein LOC133039333 [Cannabis sativa]|uniref:uncharacterized protein LOC133039333 n=1 Tax=Cannabis sativa TaxID=3483 RepID=UPI0029CA2D6B|nr:uncharacterized protein LOC133039333 [Cannabis sativa]
MAKNFLEKIEEHFAKNDKVEMTTLLSSLMNMKYKGQGNGCLSYRKPSDGERYIFVGDGQSVEVEVIGHFRLLLGTGFYLDLKDTFIVPTGYLNTYDNLYLLETIASYTETLHVESQDDYSRYGYLYLIHEKSQSVDVFKTYKAEVENQLNKRIKNVKSDRGGENIFETGTATFFEDIEFGGRNKVRDIVFEEKLNSNSVPTIILDNVQASTPVIDQEMNPEPQQDNVEQLPNQDEAIVQEEQIQHPQEQEPLRSDNIERMRIKLGFEGAYSVDANGHKGGLALLWKYSDGVRFLGFSHSHIDIEISTPNLPTWRLTGLYGEPNRSLRFKTWQLITSLHCESQLPWCIIGDINNIGNQSEKKGGRLYPSSLITGFQEVLCNCNLTDMELHGHPYTWERGKGTNNWVEIRLDKALVTSLWLDIFPSAVLSNCDVSSSDHTPIYLEPSPAAPAEMVYQFRFENAWTREPFCAQIVQACWDKNASLPLHEKISLCSKDLADWGRNLTCNFKKRIRQSKAKIASLKGNSDPSSIANFGYEQNNYFEILAQQELYWKQRSKQFWLHSGDKNSKFFHAMASNRKRSNKIQYLKNSSGVWTAWNNGLEEVMVDYFTNIYSAGIVDWNPVVNGVHCKVTAAHNLELLKSVTNLINATCDFFASATFPNHLNDTNLVLVPKKKSPSSMSDLRPIALCNVSYKVIAKVLANRMKLLIDHIISPTQSAFIPGRLISDNIIIAFEVMHYLKRKVHGKKGYMALKLDMSKAYDRVEWGYLQAIMLQMGFDHRWVTLIMACVTSVRYSIFHDGHVMGPITPSRGIRQGDPLSTYLFMICAEGFSALISKFERERLLQGCCVAQGAPMVSHMVFADDSYVFCQAHNGSAGSVLSLLRQFENASGQQINFAKSSLFFSPNVQAQLRASICSILHIPEALENSFYLGLPNIIGRNKKAILGFLKNKVLNRINSWSGKLLSSAGKEILFKTVVQALPTYAMSVFLIPLGTCDEIEKLMARFWWKTTNSKGNGIIWMKWDRLSRPKDEGGLGFRLLHDFNLAMLAKQGWRLLCYPDSLVSRLYKARYFPHDDYLSAGLGRNPSFVWRSIWSSMDLLRQGVKRTIGTGSSTSILHHPWLPDSGNPYITSSHIGLIGHTVSSLFSIDERSWDTDLVRDMFNDRDANLILSIPLSFSASSDFWSWSNESSGHFSVKSAYRSLPTCVNLRTKHVDVPPVCPVCQAALETTPHILLSCTFASSCWHHMGLPAGVSLDLSFASWLDSLFQSLDSDRVCSLAMVTWSLWKARNSIVWKDKVLTVANVLSSARIALDHWRKAQDNTSLSHIYFGSSDDGAELWTKPETNTIKVNVDAAIFASENQYGYGMVARNDSGSLIDATAHCSNGDFTPEVVEIMGIKEALSWIKRKGWKHVVLESDSLVSIQAIRSSLPLCSIFGNLAQDCRSLLLSMPLIKICFVKQSANRLAHVVARMSRYLSGCNISVSNAPVAILDVLYSEC